MSNIKEIKTTVIGTILFILGIVIFTYEYFTLGTLEWNHYVIPAAIASVGIGFLLDPDKLLNLAFRKAGKKEL